MSIFQKRLLFIIFSSRVFLQCLPQDHFFYATTEARFADNGMAYFSFCISREGRTTHRVHPLVFWLGRFALQCGRQARVQQSQQFAPFPLQFIKNTKVPPQWWMWGGSFGVEWITCLFFALVIVSGGIDISLLAAYFKPIHQRKLKFFKSPNKPHFPRKRFKVHVWVMRVWHGPWFPPVFFVTIAVFFPSSWLPPAWANELSSTTFDQTDMWMQSSNGFE